MTWWRRQRIPLIALAVALAATIGVHVWLDVLPTRSGETTSVAPGAIADIAGQHVELTSTRWDELDGPDGMRVLSVSLAASGGENATACGSLTLTDTTTGRVWVDGGPLLDERPDRDQSTCAAESGSYDVLAVFVLPDDAAGPFELDVPGDGEIARFRLEP